MNLENLGIIHEDCASDRKNQWQKENKETIVVKGDYLKLPFIEGKETEHMWIEVESIDGRVYTGKLDNDPILMENIKLGDTVTCKHEHIEQLMKL